MYLLTHSSSHAVVAVVAVDDDVRSKKFEISRFAFLMLILSLLPSIRTAVSAGVLCS